MEVFIDEPADRAALAVNGPRHRWGKCSQVRFQAGQVVRCFGVAHLSIVDGERHPHRFSAASGVYRVLDGLANEGGDVTVIEVAVTWPNEKLLLERVGLHRRFRANREFPGYEFHAANLIFPSRPSTN